MIISYSMLALKKNTFAIVTISIFVFLSLLAITLIYISQGQKIIIKNESERYNITYSKSNEFTSILDSWELWEKDKTPIEQGQKTVYTTIKKLKIISTDEPQTLLNQKNENKQILWSSGAEITDSNELIIKVHLSSELIKLQEFNLNKKRETDGLISVIVLNTVYLKINPFEGASLPTTQATIANFAKNNNNFPFFTKILTK